MLYTTDEIVQHVVVCIGREADIANLSKILFNNCLSHRLLSEGGREWGGGTFQMRSGDSGFQPLRLGDNNKVLQIML